MDQFTKFGVYVSIIGGVLFILGFTFVTSLNFTAENQVTKASENVIAFLSANKSGSECDM